LADNLRKITAYVRAIDGRPPKGRRRLIRKVRGRLKHAAHQLNAARKKGKVTGDCADQLRSTLRITAGELTAPR
jgi:hypothetical protein